MKWGRSRLRANNHFEMLTAKWFMADLKLLIKKDLFNRTLSTFLSIFAFRRQIKIVHSTSCRYRLNEHQTSEEKKPRNRIFYLNTFDSGVKLIFWIDGIAFHVPVEWTKRSKWMSFFRSKNECVMVACVMCVPNRWNHRRWKRRKGVSRFPTTISLLSSASTIYVTNLQMYGCSMGRAFIPLNRIEKR